VIQKVMKESDADAKDKDKALEDKESNKSNWYAAFFNSCTNEALYLTLLSLCSSG
jgi:hypothetical protein